LNGKVGKAQKLQALAMDIAAGTGKDLDTVSLSLAKAYSGNLGSLTRLGIKLDESIIKTKDFDAATDQLQKLFGGSAAANTETLAGKLAILKETFGELQENVGVKFIPILKRVVDEVIKVSRAFSGEDPDGLTARARELKGEVGDSGAGSLGRSLKILADSFGTLFGAITEDGDPATSDLEQFATALNNVAAGINAIAGAYKTAKSALNYIDRSGGFDTFGGFKGLPNPFKGNAMGGTVRAGVPTKVGEMGSEVFIPSTSGQIIPNHKLGGGGNTFIFNGVIDGESARRSIERVMQQSTRRTGAVNLAGAQL